MLHLCPICGNLLTLHVELAHVQATVWRRVIVPADAPLDVLHDILQAAFGWTNSHLHDFRVGDARFGMADLEDELLVVDERAAPLGAITRAGAKFIYRYDYGDNWEHVVHVESVSEDVEPTAVTCMGGARARPPEDCGGPRGYASLLSVLRDPADPEHADMRRWVGKKFDPERFDLVAVNKKLGVIGRRLARSLERANR